MIEVLDGEAACPTCSHPLSLHTEAGGVRACTRCPMMRCAKPYRRPLYGRIRGRRP